MGIMPAAGPQRDFAPLHPPKQQAGLGTRVIYWFQDETTSEIQKIVCFALLAIATFALAQFAEKPLLVVGAVSLLTTGWVKFEEYKMELEREENEEDLPDSTLHHHSFDADSVDDRISEHSRSDEVTVFDARAPESSNFELDEKEPDDKFQPFLERLMKAVGGAEKYCQIWEIPATEEDLIHYLRGSGALPLASNPQRGIVMNRNQHYFLIRFIDKEKNKKAFLLIEREADSWELTEYDEKENTLEKKEITQYVFHLIEVLINGRHHIYRLN